MSLVVYLLMIFGTWAVAVGLAKFGPMPENELLWKAWRAVVLALGCSGSIVAISLIS